MRKSISFINGHSVGDTITRIHDNTSGTSRGVEGKHSLNLDVHGGDVEGVEHDRSHLLTVSLGVEGSFSEENRVLFRNNTELYK